MAPRKTPPVMLVAAPSGDEPEPDLGADFSAFLSEIGADGSTVVQIYRKVTEPGPNVGKWAYCCKRQATGGILDDLQREYGGGSYCLKYQDATTSQYKGQKTIVIQGSPLPENAPRSSGEDRIDRIERLLMERMQAPQTDPIDVFTKMVAAITALMPKPSSDAISAKDLLSEYHKGREEASREAAQFAKLAGAADGDASSLLSVAAPLIDLAKSQIEINRATAAAAGPQAAPAPLQQIEVDTVPWWVAMLKPYVGDLFKRAQMGKNPRVYADMVMEDMPSAIVPRVAALVAEPDFLAQFCSAFPAFNNTIELQQWAAEFLDEIREWLAEAQGGGEDDPETPETAEAAANG